jgi:hypothetical protein
MLVILASIKYDPISFQVSLEWHQVWIESTPILKLNWDLAINYSLIVKGIRIFNLDLKYCKQVF